MFDMRSHHVNRAVIAYVNSNRSGGPAHPRSLARIFPIRARKRYANFIQKKKKKKKKMAIFRYAHRKTG